MADFCNILLVEDDDEDYLLSKIMLKNAPHMNFKLAWAESAEAGLKLLKQHRYDACLIDYNLGSKNGISFLKEASIINNETPFIFLTGLNDKDLDNISIQLGASDFLIKGTFDADGLERVIRHSIERKIQEIELRKTRDELAKALNKIKNNQSKLIEVENLKSVQQLAGAVAHEFSQPLQALLNYSDLIKVENPASKYCNPIKDQIEKLTLLTDNLRNITKLEKKSYIDNEILSINEPNYITQNKNHILVVDDDIFILETIIEMFELKGYKCDAAANGLEALEKTKQKKYNFIISDINMPVMDGTEFFVNFRKENKETPFIFITGYEISDEIKRVVNKADALINKPVNFESFFNMIQNLLKNKN